MNGILAFVLAFTAFSGRARAAGMDELQAAAGAGAPAEAPGIGTAGPAAADRDPVLFFGDAGAYSHQGIVRFKPEVTPEQVHAYFKTVGAQARTTDDKLNLWTFAFDPAKNKREMLTRVGSHPKALYVLPRIDPSALVIPPGKDRLDIPGTVKVRFKGWDVDDLAMIDGILQGVGAVIEDRIHETFIIRFDPSQATHQQVIDKLLATQKVEYAKPVFIFGAFPR